MVNSWLKFHNRRVGLRVQSLQDSLHNTEPGECQFWRHSHTENSFCVAGTHFFLKLFALLSASFAPPALWQGTIWLLSFCSTLHLGALASLLQDVKACHCHAPHVPDLYYLPFPKTQSWTREKNHFHFFLIIILVNIQKQRIKADGKHQDLNQYIFGRGFTLKHTTEEHISHNTFNYWSVH